MTFKTLTGMDVTYDVFPEDVYFDKVTAALSSSSSEYDAFMTGAYMTWTYGPAGWIADLNEYIKDPAKTNPNYNWDDVLPGLRASTAWNGVPGGELGSARRQAVVHSRGAIELNNIAYNKRDVRQGRRRSRRRTWTSWSTTAAKLTKDARRALRHRRARLALLGDDPSGLPVGLFELRPAGLHRRPTASSRRR